MLVNQLLPMLASAPIVEKNDKVIINYSLTFPELLYIDYSEPRLKQALKVGSLLIFLGNSEGEQKAFEDWLSHIVKVKDQFPPNEMILQTLITSIWSKTRTLIVSDLKHSQVKKDIDEEKSIRDQSDKMKVAFPLEKGKLFTAREVKWILNAHKSMLELLQAGK